MPDTPTFPVNSRWAACLSAKLGGTPSGSAMPGATMPNAVKLIWTRGIPLRFACFMAWENQSYIEWGVNFFITES